MLRRCRRVAHARMRSPQRGPYPAILARAHQTETGAAAVAEFESRRAWCAVRAARPSACRLRRPARTSPSTVMSERSCDRVSASRTNRGAHAWTVSRCLHTAQVGRRVMTKNFRARRQFLQRRRRHVAVTVDAHRTARAERTQLGTAALSPIAGNAAGGDRRRRASSQPGFSAGTESTSRPVYG